MFEIILALLFVMILLFTVYYVFCNKDMFMNKKDEVSDITSHLLVNKKQIFPKKQSKTFEKIEKEVSKNKTQNNPWLCTILKGHTDDLLDFTLSTNGRTLITCSRDHFILIWNTQEFVKGHIPLRLNLAPDYADFVRFSPDNKAFIVHLNSANILRVYAISKKEAPKSYKHFDLPRVHSGKMVGFEVASTGIFLMSYYADSSVVFTNFKGHELKRIDTEQITLEECLLSPCSRFIATRGLTADAKLWKTSAVSMDEMGALDCFASLSLNTPIKAFSFSADSSKIATVGEDCEWKIWDYMDVSSGRVREAPTVYSFHGGCGKPQVPRPKLSKTDKALKKISGPADGNERENTTNYDKITCCLSEDFTSLALITFLHTRGDVNPGQIDANLEGFGLTVYGTVDAKLIDQLKDDPFCIDSCLIDYPTKVTYALQDSYILVSGHEKWIYVLHNIPGYKTRIEGITAKLRHESNPMAIQRLQEQKASLEIILREIVDSKKHSD